METFDMQLNFMYDLFCNALYFLTVCWDYFNKMFFFKYICVLINIYIYTGVQLGGCLDGMPSPFTIPIKEPRTIDRLAKQRFFVGINMKLR